MANLMNTTLMVPLVNQNNKYKCNVFRCMLCEHKSCLTGQEARKHGRKGMESVIKMIEDSDTVKDI